MAEQGGEEKTEKATPKKLKDARKEGNIFQSKEVINVVSITREIQSAIDILENNCRVIPVTRDGETMMCNTDRI